VLTVNPRASSAVTTKPARPSTASAIPTPSSRKIKNCWKLYGTRPTPANCGNPRQLRQEIYDLIDQIFALPGAVPGVTEDVFQTLMSHPSSEREEEEDDDSLTFSFNRTTILEED
jgi:hypothetical protein